MKTKILYFLKFNWYLVLIFSFSIGMIIVGAVYYSVEPLSTLFLSFGSGIACSAIVTMIFLTREKINKTIEREKRFKDFNRIIGSYIINIQIKIGSLTNSNKTVQNGLLLCLNGTEFYADPMPKEIKLYVKNFVKVLNDYCKEIRDFLSESEIDSFKRALFSLEESLNKEWVSNLNDGLKHLRNIPSISRFLNAHSNENPQWLGSDGK